MGRIAKMKRQMIMEANKRLLGEQDLIMETPLMNGGIKPVGLENIRKFEPQIDELLKNADSNLKAGFGYLNSGNIYHWKPTESNSATGTFTFYNIREGNGLPITGQIGVITKRNVSNQIGSGDNQDFSWSAGGVSAADWNTLKKDNGNNALAAFSAIYDDMDANLFNIVSKKVQQSADQYKQSFANAWKETIDKNPTFKTINIEKNTLKPNTQSRKLYELFKYEPQQNQPQQQKS